MSISIISGLFAAALVTFLAVQSQRYARRGERCRQCGVRGQVVHEEQTARCLACKSQWADGGHGWG